MNIYLHLYNGTKNIFYNEAHTLGINYITDGQACTCDLAFQNFKMSLMMFHQYI